MRHIAMPTIILAFWVFVSGQEPISGSRSMPDIAACWAEAAKLQQLFARDQDGKADHVQIDVSCITEWDQGG
jgi:hypothetical protein